MAREMKDSGIEWIGEMPAEWNVIAFWQAILRMGTGLNPRDNFQLTKIDPLYYVTIRNFKDGHLFLDDSCDRISKDAWEVIQERSDLQKGDILFASISKDGQAYILESDPVNWNINESVFCIRVNPEYFTEKYFYYHLINAGYYEDLRMDATGSTFQSIKQNKLRKSRMVLPPLSEQKRISDFLDRKCSEIDSVIADTQHTIEEYKKLKQSIITEAVTKGVRGKRPMKDSGIEWIGEIPEEWYCTVLKRFCKFQTGGTPSTANQDWFDGDVDWFTPGDFSDNYLLSNSSRKLSEKAITDKAAVVIPENTVLIIGIGGTAGKIGITTQMCSCNQQITALLQDEHIFSRYLMYWMIANTKFLKETALFTTLPIINNQTIGEYVIVLPNTIEEQQEIAAYLDEKCIEIDCLIQAKQNLLVELESYKKSVIYEYVTGKKEVPACQ